MAAPKGIAAIEWLAKRTKEQRGGNEAQPDHFDRSTPDALALWRDAYLESLRTRNYAEGTIEGRVFDLKFFLAWAEERDLKQASQITRPILEAFQHALWRYTQPNGQRLSWTTQRGRLGTIKDWFRWMTKQNVIMHNPASELEMPRPEKRLPKEVLSLSEMERLLAVPNVTDPLGIRDRAMLELFYSTGMRRAELCGLDLSDFNAERHTLHVRGKGKKDRVVPVGQRAAYWIEHYLQVTRPRLCLDTRTQAMFLTGYGGPFNPDVVSRMVSDWMEKAGLPKKGSCHLLRHTCATHMLEGGADIRYIQQLLGHEKLDTTAIYTEVSIKQLQEVHARCHPAARLENALGSLPAPVNGASNGPADGIG
jgi:integrase/recombinase XerD